MKRDWRSLTAVVSALLPSRLRILVLRHVLGARVGKRVRIGIGSVMLVDEMDLGDGVTLGRGCRIKAQRFALGPESSVGRDVKISVHSFEAGPRTTIAARVDIAGDRDDCRSSFTMGMHCWIFSYCYLDVSRPITLGRNVGIGGGSYLFTHGQWLSKLSGYPVSHGTIAMGNDVWIPWGCFVMPGVSVGSGAVVGARALLTRDVPPGALAAGVPAKVLRDSAAKAVDQTEVERTLLELCDEFAQYHRLLIAVCRHEKFVDVEFGRDGRLRLHNAPPKFDDLLHPGLNVTMCDSDERFFADRQILRLTDSLTSSYSDFGDLARKWLAYARNIGVRFYPIDEVTWQPYWRSPQS